MGTFSDQAAADRAAAQGEAGVRMQRHPRLYAIEPAEGSAKGYYAWRECPPLYFTTKAPVCADCGTKVGWVGPAERRADPEGGDDLWVYRVQCCCHEEVQGEDGRTYVTGRLDELVVGFPLRMGGTSEFWDRYRRG